MWRYGKNSNKIKLSFIITEKGENFMENILEILDIPDNTKYWLVRAGQGEE